MRFIGGALVASWIVTACPAMAPAAASDVRFYSLPASLKHPDRIAAGPDGALWFTQHDYERARPQDAVLGRITTAGAVSVISLPAGTEPRGLAIGPDQGLWYAGVRDERGRLGQLTSAGADEVVLPAGNLAPSDVATGPDGTLWFADGDRIGRLASGRALTLFPLPAPLGGADQIAAGPNGALWFTDSTESRIGRITTDGRVRLYRLTYSDEGPTAITAGPDGAVWFAHTLGIARILHGGEITELHLPEPPGEPSISLQQDPVSGPDGALWFTRQTHKLDLRRPLELGAASGDIGRIDIASLRGPLLVTRLDNKHLRGGRGSPLRVRFTSTHTAAGIVRLERGTSVEGTRILTRQRIRARAGPNTITLRLPQRPGTYRLLVRLSLTSQSGSDGKLVRVTR